MTEPYTLQHFVADLRRITAGSAQISAILQQVKPLARRLAASSGLRERCTVTPWTVVQT